ncbi:methylated-DNA-[protein]-cysteine S-methyltransferase [Spirosomataceae bacterium TFI 002]|nr:methylated-DNA-[protein]-cysteine S-methyltransferase [Spirosomataceae bacterium TFI 002]
MELHSNEEAITDLKFKGEAGLDSAAPPQELLKAKKQLEEYLLGKRLEFDLKLEPKGTEFQQKVWAELQNIPFGKTISYQELANKLGDPKVIRAAASANGKNPIGLIIPCHRVIGQNGKLVGFSGGLSRKKWLLDHENKHANGVLTLF